ncbi:MAG: gamma-glutamyltransferase family protein [Gemmatimonadetes bacterium]|nr:gamma-glutamyltransferase family protein [Gemmatimonadota bacterium]
MLSISPARVLATAALLLSIAPAAARSQDTTRAARPAPPRMAEDPRTAPTMKPPLHARHWLAITGKPLSAAAGSLTFARGGNAVDATVAMLAAGCTVWDTLSCGGETQALIYDPRSRQVIGIDALGVAPTGATPAFYQAQGYRFPPEYGPLAAVTPGTVGGMLVMLAEYGKLSLKEVLAPAIELADGYPIEAQLANTIERQKDWIKKWKYAPAVMLPHAGQAREAPQAGEIFRQPDLAATWRKLVAAEQQALAAGRDRKQAIQAAYDRFYKGDIAREIVRGAQEDGALFTMQDLANWQVKIEQPLHTSYRGIEVYKLPIWQQGPALLQALNMLENTDVKALGYNSPRYLHTLYQVMSLAFADRDFYYGDPYFPPEEPVAGLLSKEYARARFALVNPERNDPNIKPGDPYPFMNATNPFRELLAQWDPKRFLPPDSTTRSGQQDRAPGAVRRDTTSSAPDAVASRDPGNTDDPFYRGTTSIVAADAEGWLVSVTPSGGWVPAVIAGHTGIGLSQRAQSFVTAPEDGPFNVIEPGKRPRVTLTPTIALKDGAPYLAFAVQGGDTQDQNLLQFFLDIVEFGMTPQQAAEAPNINSYQMLSSFGIHETRPGRMLAATSLPESTRQTLRQLGYTLEFAARTSGPINAILIDTRHGSMWGGSSNHGEDYGIGW